MGKPDDDPYLISPDPEPDFEAARARFDELAALYPRDVAASLIEAFHAAHPPDDRPMFPGVSAEDLERQMETFVQVTSEEAPPELRAELEELKEHFRNTRGKKLSELPAPTPEEQAAFLADEVETAVHNVLTSWINMLWEASQDADGQPIRLDTNFVPVPPPPQRDAGDGTLLQWYEEPCNSIALTPDQVQELHKAFAANLRPLVDAAPDGYALSLPELVIKKDAQGYFLVRRP